MKAWVILLRLVGIAVFITGFVVGMIRSVGFLSSANEIVPTSPVDSLAIFNGSLESLAIALLCFAGASALKRIDRVDRKVNIIGSRMVSRPARPAANPSPPTNFPLPPSMMYPDPLDLAPDAPRPANTSRYADEGEKIRRSSKRVITRVEQDYIDRRYAYRVADPNVRAAPKPIRQTPGTAGQYMDEEIAEETQRRALPNPSNPYNRSINEVPEKELLKLGRDTYLRRQQGGK